VFKHSFPIGFPVDYYPPWTAVDFPLQICADSFLAVHIYHTLGGLILYCRLYLFARESHLIISKTLCRVYCLLSHFCKKELYSLPHSLGTVANCKKRLYTLAKTSYASSFKTLVQVTFWH